MEWLTTKVRSAMVKLAHRTETVGELVAYVARHRPTMLPLVGTLLALVGFVALAQASQISPLIYTLF